MHSAITRSAVAARKPSCWREARDKLLSTVQARNQTRHSATRLHGRSGRANRGWIRGAGGRSERAVVVTVTVALAGLVPSSGTLEGETAQVELGGGPEQLHVTVGVKRPPGGAATV